MKILHTSDWHLGKRLFKSERLPEQERFLEWLIKTIKEEQVDVLIVAGDIFDVPSPPNLAQKLFFKFIYQLKEFKDLTTIIIGGNHDSSSLLQIPENFFSDLNCFIRSGLPNGPEESDIIIEKEGVKYGFKTLPYFRNFELLNSLSSEESEDENIIKDYFHNYFSSWKQKASPDFKFLIAHHVFGNYEMSGSEHAIHLSGIDHFPLDWVNTKFDYVALGHIHKKMTLSESPPIIYPGSPIPMRFSESGKKRVSLVEIQNNKLSYKMIEIPPFRNLIKLALNLENYQDELKKLISSEAEQELPTFLEVNMYLDAPEKGLADIIREKLKKSNIQLLSYIPLTNNLTNKKLNQIKVGDLSIEELFKKYFTEKYPESDVPKEIINSFNELLQDINNEDS